MTPASEFDLASIKERSDAVYASKLVTGQAIPAVRVSILLPPPAGVGIRAINKEHRNKLIQEMENSVTGMCGMPMAVNVVPKVPNPGPFDLQSWLDHPDTTKYDAFVIGGNHTRSAKRHLMQKYAGAERFASHPCHIFYNLSPEEAQDVGFMHQDITQTFHKYSQKEKIYFFREQWEADVNRNAALPTPQPLSQLVTTFRKTMGERFCDKNSRGKPKMELISPLLGLAQSVDEVWRRIDQIFNAAEAQDLKGMKQKRPSTASVERASKKAKTAAASASVFRVSLLSKDEKHEDPVDKASHSVNRQLLSACTTGEMTTENICEILDSVLAKENTLKEAAEVAFQVKGLNVLIKYLIKACFHSQGWTIENFDWHYAATKYPGMTLDVVKSYVSAINRAEARGGLRVPESFKTWVSRLMTVNTAEVETAEHPSTRCFSHEGVSGSEKWTAMGRLHVGDVHSFFSLRIVSRPYNLVILDPPYGFNRGNWDQSAWTMDQYITLVQAIIRVNLASSFTLAIFQPIELLMELKEHLTPFFNGGFEVFYWVKSRNYDKAPGPRLVSAVETLLLCYHTEDESRSRELYHFGRMEPRLNYFCSPVPNPMYRHQDKVVNKTQKPVLLIAHLINHWSKPDQWILDLCSGSGAYPFLLDFCACLIILFILCRNCGFHCLEVPEALCQRGIGRVSGWSSVSAHQRH